MNPSLTPPQQQAVDHFEGPLLVLAGPGSGKTRVITYRIARLLQRGVKPEEILALTFTNKAAREMSERVHGLLGNARVHVSTFHSFCARLLRRFPDQVGLKDNFTILDSSDQVQLVRSIMKELGFDTTTLDPRRVLNRISNSRNNLISAESFRQQYEERVGDPVDTVVYEVFPEYELQVLHQNSVDFDALLLHVVEILSSNEQMRDFLDRSYRFVLVDEYQDTNLAQYRIVRGLSHVFPNLCATGDPDQSIYGWRGARPENLAQFEADFPQTKVVSLDQNFRSTQEIVRCAGQLISHNTRRHRNDLFTENPPGSRVRLRVFADSEDEAHGVAEEIAEHVDQGHAKYSDFAIFYRVNALSRPMETALSFHGVPFQVASGYSFYDRVEVRDLLGFLRLIENPEDDVAFLRVINRPPRGIGEKTLQTLSRFAREHELSLLAAAARADEVPRLGARRRGPLKEFHELIENLAEAALKCRVDALIERLIGETNYMSLWLDENDEVDEDRRGNVYELINAARLYEDALQGTDEQASLQGFLELASLTSEVDSVDQSRGAVTLMTLHAAKGLEFPSVYILGVENGLIPHDRAMKHGDPASFQEERRLLFVGVTRAMQELNLTQTRRRNFRGSWRSTISSPYVPEMDLDVVCEDDDLAPPVQSINQVDARIEKARQRYEASRQRADGPAIMSAADLEKRLRSEAIRIEKGAEAAHRKRTADEVTDGPEIDAVESAGTAGMVETSSPLPTASIAPMPTGGALNDARQALQRLTQKKMKSKAATGSPPRFAMGERVRHPRYGRGVVTEVSDGSSRATVTVQFEVDDRCETFVAAHCPLQPLGGS